MIAFNTSNCAWKHSTLDKIVVADYKPVKMIDTSPFIYNKDMFGVMVKEVQEKSQVDNKPVWLPYGLTRGCPFSCTFCDWNGGLGNKVSRRKNTYQQEIDLFEEMQLTNLYLADANVGQYDEDVELIDYLAQKNISGKADFTVMTNFSKLNKVNNLKIFHLFGQGKLTKRVLNFSFQDIDPTVLENIDRPDIGWEEHLAMANQVRQAYPHLVVKAQLICGLPGQTRETWQQTLLQLVKENIMPIIFLNEPLPASPALTDPDYQDKFQFEYVKSFRLDWGGRLYSSLIPKKCVSFDQRELVEMYTTSMIVHAVSFVKLRLSMIQIELDAQPLVEHLLRTKNYHWLCDNLYHNWTVDNMFCYTINFSGQSIHTLPADSHGSVVQMCFQEKDFLLEINKLIKGKTAMEVMKLFNNYSIFVDWVFKLALEFH